MQSTIVGMAQSFVGSNNINLLVPSGQFGTRLQGGKDHASARYIYTRLERITRLIFHPDDDLILDFQTEEGQTIEPRWYIPVIPMVLVNGADGIGTGWSTSLPNYNPRDIIAALRQLIKKEPLTKKLKPWYKGFKGTITPSDSEDKTGYEVVGIAKRTATNSIEVTELPIGRWTDNYKEFLSRLVTGGEGERGKIDGYKEYHTENTVHFVLEGVVDQMKSLESEGLEKSLKLRSSISTNNMVFFDKEGKIKKYSSEQDILKEFAELRLQYYQKRKDFHVDRLGREKEFLDAKVRFILMVIRGELVVEKRKKVELVAELKSKGFKTQNQILSKSGTKEATENTEEKGGFDYLLGMPIWSLTWERVEDMKRKSKEKTEELNTLQKLSPETMWERDLDAIAEELDAIDEWEKEMQQDAKRLKSGGRGRGGSSRSRGRGSRSAKRTGAGGKREREEDEDDDSSEDEDDDEDDEAPPPKKKAKTGEEESAADLLARLRERQKERSKMQVG